jgi:hypothetical protein
MDLGWTQENDVACVGDATNWQKFYQVFASLQLLLR